MLLLTFASRPVRHTGIVVHLGSLCRYGQRARYFLRARPVAHGRRKGSLQSRNAPPKLRVVLVLGSWVGYSAPFTFSYPQLRPACFYPKILVLRRNAPLRRPCEIIDQPCINGSKDGKRSFALSGDSGRDAKHLRGLREYYTRPEQYNLYGLRILKYA